MNFYSIKCFIKKRYFRLTSNIAFVPASISVIFFIIACSLLYLEQTGVFNDIKESHPWINIKSASNARVIVSTILAGLISLTVFSFSMVMSVLSQAYSNFTPKVIGDLINNKSNQSILGVYIGSIIYCLIILISFRDNDYFSVLPSVAIVVSTFIGLFCLGLFVKFINNISQSIQIKNVIKRIYLNTIEKIQENKTEIKTNIPYTENWNVYYSREDGYFQSINESDLIRFLEKNDLIIKIEVITGDFVVRGMKLFSVNKPISEPLTNKIYSEFNFYSEEDIKVSDFYGFRQLNEIATKALSPGINDTGTSIVCIDFLTSLLIYKMENKNKLFQFDDNGNIRLLLSCRSFQEYLDASLIPIFIYGKSDVYILIKLLESLKKITISDFENNHQHIFKTFAEYLIKGAKEEINLEYEKSKVNTIILELKKLDIFYFLEELN